MDEGGLAASDEAASAPAEPVVEVFEEIEEMAGPVEDGDEHDDPEIIEAPGESELEEVEEAEEETEEEELTEEETEERVAYAATLKAQGNALFKEEDWERATAIYGEALGVCPKRHESRAALSANRAACYLKLEKYEDCVLDCTRALEIKPVYSKVNLRRAMASEKLERFEDALEDYNAVLKHEPGNDFARAAAKRLPAQIEAQREKLKDEMLGNLKKLGNMCLRPFGLSTNNFNMVQDPNTGGYSMNFQQNGNKK